MLEELKARLLAVISGYKEMNAAKKQEAGTDNAQPQKVAATAKAITDSVGQGGKNNPEDVKIVKALLNAKINAGLTAEDGSCGPKTIAAISKFQQSVGMAKPDGRIDAGGNTWKKLSGGATVTPPAGGETKPPAGAGGSASKPKWVAVAEGELGVAEYNTKNPDPSGKLKHHPRIIEYHATTGGFKDDETPWCASFVNWVMIKAGYSGTNSAMAVSWGKWGKSSKDNKPALGAIAVKTRKGGGHVGIVVGKSGNKLVVLGGNQGDKVCKVNYNAADFFAFRFPANYDIPANAYLLEEGSGEDNSGREG